MGSGSALGRQLGLEEAEERLSRMAPEVEELARILARVHRAAQVVAASDRKVSRHILRTLNRYDHLIVSKYGDLEGLGVASAQMSEALWPDMEFMDVIVRWDYDVDVVRSLVLLDDLESHKAAEHLEDRVLHSAMLAGRGAGSYRDWLIKKVSAPSAEELIGILEEGDLEKFLERREAVS